MAASLPPDRRLAAVPDLHLRRHRRSTRSRSGSAPTTSAPSVDVGAHDPRRRLPRHLRRRARDPDRRLRPPARRTSSRTAGTSSTSSSSGSPSLPGLRDNVTLLRLARLLRVVRLVSVMPDLRILVRAMARSLPPIASLVAAHAAAHVRLRDGRLDPLPRGGSRAVGQHRPVAAEPVPDPHARELARSSSSAARRSTRPRGSSSSPTC